MLCSRSYKSRFLYSCTMHSNSLHYMYVLCVVCYIYVIFVCYPARLVRPRYWRTKTLWFQCAFPCNVIHSNRLKLVIVNVFTFQILSIYICDWYDVCCLLVVDLYFSSCFPNCFYLWRNFVKCRNFHEIATTFMTYDDVPLHLQLNYYINLCINRKRIWF